MAKFLYTLLTFALFSISFGQTPKKKMNLSPKKQYTPNFKFKPFQRSHDITDELDAEIRTVEAKPKSQWNSFDSIIYACELLYLNEPERAGTYLVNTNYDSIQDAEHLHLIQEVLYKIGDFDDLVSSIQREKDLFPLDKEIADTRIKLGNALSINKKGNWNDTSLIFPFLRDTIYYEYNKNTIHRKTILIPLAESIDEGLRYYIDYEVNNKNKFLAQAYVEYGDFLNKHFYESNAYIAYSIARYYNKSNTEASNKLKSTKKTLENKNYIVPSFRKVFKKIQPGRFNYAMLKEKQGEEKVIEEVRKNSPIKVDKDYIPGMSTSLLIIIIFAVALLMVLLFVRTKKVKKKAKSNPQKNK